MNTLMLKPGLNMRKILFFILLIPLFVSAQVSVCGVYLDESGQVNSPYIKSGAVTWDATSRTLTLDNAIVEYSSNNPQDGIRPIRVTNDATIIVQGDCKLTTTGHVAIAIDSYSSKNVTIKGNGTLSTSSSWIDIFLVVAHLTIQDITLNTVNGISNNAEGNGVGLAFNNVQATIKGDVARIGDGITFTNCAITYPTDAYIEQTGYGYSIYYGNHQSPDKIIISRIGSDIKGDVNNDGEVNIADVNAVIDVVLGGGSNNGADVNKDAEINIADINAVIDIILGGSAPTPNHEYVDLGLPSGTQWATCNIGASSPEQCGNYYAWGETATKDNYDINTYKWHNNSDEMMTVTKYCIHSDCGYEGFTDGKTELDPEDDAAYVNWGPQWRMPTYEQLAELKTQCTWKSSTLNGVKGRMATGPNGNSIFLPTAGIGEGESILSVGTHGNYWSRTLYWDNSCKAIDLGITTGKVYGHNATRAIGFSVRAVRVSQN